MMKKERETECIYNVIFILFRHQMSYGTCDQIKDENTTTNRQCFTVKQISKRLSSYGGDPEQLESL